MVVTPESSLTVARTLALSLSLSLSLTLALGSPLDGYPRVELWVTRPREHTQAALVRRLPRVVQVEYAREYAVARA